MSGLAAMFNDENQKSGSTGGRMNETIRQAWTNTNSTTTGQSSGQPDNNPITGRAPRKQPFPQKLLPEERFSIRIV